MNVNQRQIVDGMAEALRTGRLDEAALRDGVAAALAAAGAKRQDLLYLQADGTSLFSGILGMILIEGGKQKYYDSNAKDWPYESVQAAINDGWRVISFPNMALLATDEREGYGLGFEFILERWG